MLQDISFDRGEIFEQWRTACDVAQTMGAQNRLWHKVANPPEGSLLLHLHRANFDLWHLEDQARDPVATDAAIALVKRSIDSVNQRRNDLVERLDGELLRELAARFLLRRDAPLHSETPGQMFDRLSILSLKIFHTAEEAGRTDASDAHRTRNRERLLMLQEQQDDLCGCLSELFGEVVEGRRQFKQYRQLKMYNDAELNPVLYRAASRLPESDR